LTRYIILRIILLIPVIIAVSFIVFTLVELAPGDIVDQMITGEMTREDIDALRAKYDLDKSMFYRYGKYMWGLIRGDLGISQSSGAPVFDTYLQRLPNTLLLAFSAAIIGTAISIPMGIRAARKAGTITDTATTTFTLIGMSMPAFWLGLLLMLLFSLQLGWFPAGGNQDGIRSLVLPTVCCAMTLMATSARQTRSSMLEVLKADFLRTARAKGAPERIVIRKHALGNAMIPIITQIGTSICVQLAGSAVIEQVFTWPGVGRMLITGVVQRDVTVVLGCVIMTTILYVLVQLIVDLLYAFVDPRIKSQYVGRKRRWKGADAVTIAGNLGFAAPIDAPEPEAGAAADGVNSTEEVVSVSHIISENDKEYETGCIGGAAYANDADFDSNANSAREDGKYVTRRDENIMPGDTILDTAGIITKYKKRSQFGEIVHRLVHNKSSLAGIIILGFIFLLALASLFMSYDNVIAQNIPARFTPPSWKYPFGTDGMGRNVFLRVIYGSRYSIVVGFGAMILAALVGVTLGSTAAYYGGRTENIIMRISDTLASIPSLLLGMVIMVVLGQSLQNLIIAVGVGGIPLYIRMSRASILTVKGNEFVEAARAIGFGNLRIIATQVLPNGLSPIIVQATTTLGISITISASLSFLGFGIPAPTPEWGSLIAAGREFAQIAPWLMAFPGVAIMVTVLGFNLLGDGLRDALDPKLKK